MKKKYEIIEIEGRDTTFDVSELLKEEIVWFNATAVAKQFGKQPVHWLRNKDNVDYINALAQSANSQFQDFVRVTRGGKYQGTWLHKSLALHFARWLDPHFAVALDQAILEMIEQGREQKRKRLEAKTGFLPLTEAIMADHDDPQHYHFSNECDMINRIVLGMSAKKYKEIHGVSDVRDNLCAAEITQIQKLQKLNTSLIELGFGYDERKARLKDFFATKLIA